MNKKTTLCIIDMQPKFKAFKQALPGVLHEIKIAKKNKDNIILVEYVFESEKYPQRTHKDILKEIKKYKHFICSKVKDDGSEDIIYFAKKWKISLSHLRVCGVNLGYCVLDTVKGLAQRANPRRIEVVLDATYCQHGYSNSLKMIKRAAKSHDNIKLI